MRINGLLFYHLTFFFPFFFFSFYTYVRLHLKPLSFVKRFFPFDVNHAKIFVEVTLCGLARRETKKRANCNTLL